MHRGGMTGRMRYLVACFIVLVVNCGLDEQEGKAGRDDETGGGGEGVALEGRDLVRCIVNGG